MRPVGGLARPPSAAGGARLARPSSASVGAARPARPPSSAAGTSTARPASRAAALSATGSTPASREALPALRSRLSSVESELVSVRRECERARREGLHIVRGSLEGHRDALLTEVRALEGELADLNLAQDKARSGVAVGELRAHAAAHERRNAELAAEADAVFLQRADVDAHTAQMTREVEALAADAEAQAMAALSPAAAGEVRALREEIASLAAASEAAMTAVEQEVELARGELMARGGGAAEAADAEARARRLQELAADRAQLAQDLAHARADAAVEVSLRAEQMAAREAACKMRRTALQGQLLQQAAEVAELRTLVACTPGLSQGAAAAEELKGERRRAEAVEEAALQLRVGALRRTLACTRARAEALEGLDPAALEALALLGCEEDGGGPACARALVQRLHAETRVASGRADERAQELMRLRDAPAAAARPLELAALLAAARQRAADAASGGAAARGDAARSEAAVAADPRALALAELQRKVGEASARCAMLRGCMDASAQGGTDEAAENDELLAAAAVVNEQLLARAVEE